MKHGRVTVMVLCTLMFCCGGCSRLFPGSRTAVPVAEGETALARGRDLLKQGREQEARAQLERVLESAPTGGITDEALFRLSLLVLRDEGGKGSTRAQRLLEQLHQQYPQSIWTRQAAPLAGHLAETKNLRDRQRELKTLRELNLSLNRDNRELRQTIERLKSLDLELEQKIGR